MVGTVIPLEYAQTKAACFGRFTKIDQFAWSVSKAVAVNKCSQAHHIT